MRAARYLKVPVWELEERSVLYRNRALMAQSIEREAERYRQQHPR